MSTPILQLLIGAWGLLPHDWNASETRTFSTGLEAKCAFIQPGMAEAQVRLIFGQPTSSSFGRKTLDNGKVIEERATWWEFGSEIVVVNYDDGVVSGKRYRIVRPTYWELLSQCFVQAVAWCRDAH